MFRAGCLLRQSELAVGEISSRIGYESEVASTKAFKRSTGRILGVFRRVKFLPPVSHVQIAATSTP
jgi:transcriptional regulator GlxA family with amidase domain